MTKNQSKAEINRATQIELKKNNADLDSNADDYNQIENADSSVAITIPEFLDSSQDVSRKKIKSD